MFEEDLIGKTHWTCNKRLEKEGGDAGCCDCTKHDDCGDVPTTPNPELETTKKLEDIASQISGGMSFEDIHSHLLFAYHLGAKEVHDVSGWMRFGERKGYADYFRQQGKAEGRKELPRPSGGVEEIL